jgi:hypothetical protein
MGKMMTDLTDEDGALAKMEDLGDISCWLLAVSEFDPGPEPEFEPPPTGENLLDQASREKLPLLYSGETRIGGPGEGQVLHARQQLDLVCQRVRWRGSSVWAGHWPRN